MRAILRSLQAERSGQLTFDFRIDAEPARIIKLKRPKPREIGKEPGKDTGVPLAAPQTLAEEYFMKASALDADESRHNAAATWYRKALEIDPYLVPALINLANIHYGKDELAEAQALYERAIGLDPDFFEAHFNLGNIYHDLGRFKEAATCYRTALGLNGQYADAHFYLAITLEKTGHSARSETALARVSGAVAERRMGRAGEGVLGVEGVVGSRWSSVGSLSLSVCRLATETDDYRLPTTDCRLITIIFNSSLLRHPPYLVELAVGAPGFGVEAGRSRHRLHVAMRTEIERVGFLGRFPPPAAVILLNRRRLLDRRLFGCLDGGGSGEW